MRSPSFPFRWLRSRRLSDFRWPKIGSMAALLAYHRQIPGFMLFFFLPARCTIVSVMSLPAPR